MHLPHPSGLIDLQVNGFAGTDFQQDDLGQDQLESAARALVQAGCERFLLTLVTDRWNRLLSRLTHLRRLRRSSPTLRQIIAGWHLEGPFLSSSPGYHGAHDPACMLDPTRGHLDALLDIVGDDPLLLTLAPERKGALDFIARATAQGAVVSLGHTDASATCLREAVAAGARAFTHLGNACPQQLDRHDNILWRVLELENIYISLIPDMIHVAPALFRIVHRLVAPDRIIYVTDAMAAAGAPPGRYKLGRLELEVGADGVVRQPGRANFAGSSLTPAGGLRRAAEMLGTTPEQAVAGWTSNPARMMGWKPEAAPVRL